MASGSGVSACAVTSEADSNSKASALFLGSDMVFCFHISPPGTTNPKASGLCRHHRLGQVFRDLVEEAGGGEPALVGADQERKVLGHVAGLDGVDANPLQRGGKLRQSLVVVELGAMRQAAGPGKDRGDRIGRGFLALLMLSVVPRHRAVRGLAFPRVAVGR